MLLMNDICKSDANQLNAPAVFKHFLVKNKKKVFYESCFALVCFQLFLHEKKIKNLLAPRFLLNGCNSTYEELIKQNGNVTVNLKNHKSLCIEVY